MFNAIKIVIGLLIFVFGFYLFIDDSRKGIKEKLTEKEKKYFDIIEIWFYISVIGIPCILITPIFE